MTKKNLVKILVLCLIVAVIAGIYLFKNPPATTQAPEDSTAPEDTDFALTATEAIDFETLAEHGLPIIVDYGSDSCIPCQQMAPVLKTMNEEMTGNNFGFIRLSMRVAILTTS